MFYNATEHRQCLEGLELAIRMRRGLSVVQGGVGVGKTTVSRKLIQIFDDESDIYDFYLILDPKFESELILLQHLIELFDINEKGDSVQDCRNIIEHHLLKIGVEQGKVLILIIDEGQNLEAKYLDAFRTLLNFETDDYKLLQLIIFGQPEMGSIIKEYPNFEDRISFHYEIGPLDLDDTDGFITHRLNVTGAEDHQWFSDEVVEKIFRYTNGFPRKVTKICHQLLLYMISEGKDIIDTKMFQDVLAGKSPTGLLKKEKPEAATAAANKLLNVLRKNKIEKVEPVIDEEEEDDDDWIGGIAPVDSPETVEELVLEDDEDDIVGLEPEKPETKSVTPKPVEKIKTTPTPVDPDPIEKEKPEKPISDPVTDNRSGTIRPADPVVHPGQFPEGISPPVLLREEAILGLAVDGNKIVAVVLQDHRKTKRLIDIQVYTHPEKIDFIEDPEGASNAVNNILKICERSVESKDFLTKKIIASVASGASIAMSINDALMYLKRVDIPKNSQKDRKKIIGWNAKKQLPFEPDLLQHDAVNQGKNKEIVLVGITNHDRLKQAGDIFSGKDWAVRWWHPVPMAIHNAFIWNYPEKAKETCFVLHMGETESFLLGYSDGCLQIIHPLAIGIQNINDALTDSTMSQEHFRVPPSLLPGKTKSVTGLSSDDQLRPIIESWSRELDRCLTGLKRNFPVSESSTLFLSGTAIEIESIDEYFEGHLNIITTFINPLRNIAILPDESERDQIKIPLPLLTSALGSALNLPQTVNLLPPVFKQSESFRLMVQIGIRAAALLLISLFSFTGWTSLKHTTFSNELESLTRETEQLSPIKDTFNAMDENRASVETQLNELSHDTEYFQRIISTLRFLSHHTPDEITFNEVRFQMGWEVSQNYAYGQEIRSEIKVVDAQFRILKLSGTVSANSAYKDRIFQIFIDDLEETSLFSQVEIVSNHTTKGLDVQELTFVLKCII